MEKEINKPLEMRSIILTYILLFTTFITSCQNIDVKKQIQERYKQSVQFFESDLVSHFPAEFPDSCWYVTTVPKNDTLEMAGFGVDKLFMTYSLSQYKAIASDFRNLPSTTYSANDSSLLLVFDYCDVVELEGKIYKDQEPPERQKLAKHNITTASSLPVPIFEIDQYQGNTMSGLPIDFKLHVLDAKPGKYIDEKHLQECECLPEKWKHGYSKGVALSDEKQVVIYWVIVW